MTLDDEITRLDQRILQLRIQFDLFFTGGLSKPPLNLRDDLDRDVKRLGNTREMKLAQRFLYNNLLNRWNIFNELWNKRLQALEEGTRTPTIARRRKAAQPPAGPMPESPKPSPDESRLLARTSIRNAVESEGELRAFYRSFLEARQECGNGKTPSFERFRREIERHVEAIRQKASCDTVDFRLYLQNNKVVLKARPLKEEEEEAS